MTTPWARCEALVSEACGGDEAAWSELTALLWPHWIERVGNHRAMGSLARDEDHVHEVAVRLVDKLAPRGGAALGLYPAWRERHPHKAFEDWMNIVVAFTVRDHVRATLGQSKQRDPELPSVKRLLNEFSTSPAVEAFGGWRPAFTSAHWLTQMLEFARRKLREQQLDALTLWLQGAEYDEMGEHLGGVNAAEARKLVRSAIAVLRRRFADDDH